MMAFASLALVATSTSAAAERLTTFMIFTKASFDLLLGADWNG